MWLYILLPILIMYGIVIQRLLIIKSPNAIAAEAYSFKPTRSLLAFWFLALLAMGIYKGIYVGTDSFMYYHFFKTHSYNQVEPAIQLFYQLAHHFNHYLLFQLSVSFTFLYFMFNGMKKNCPDFLMSLLFFILTFTYYASFNQMRQMLAVAVIFCFVSYLTASNTEKLKFSAIILFASLFHYSALFLLLLFIIPQKRWSLKIVIPAFIAVIILYFIPAIKNVIGETLLQFSSFYGNKYGNNVNFFFQMNKEKGWIQLLPVVVQMGFVISSYFSVNNNLKNDKLFFLSSNLVVLNLILYALAGIEAIDRLQLYFSVFNIYFYSFYIHQLLNNEQKLKGYLMSTVIVLFWLLYYSLRLLANHHGIVPYRFFS